MARKKSAKSLVKAVLGGDLTFDAAMEEHLHENYRGSLDIPSYSKVNLALCYANMGWNDRVLDLRGDSMTVADIIKEFGLEPFLPLFNQQEGACFKMGQLVSWYDKVFRVIGRRAVGELVDHRFDDWEVFLESLDGGSNGFYSESEVEPVDEGKDTAPGSPESSAQDADE